MNMKLDTDSMNATNSALKRDREIIKKIYWQFILLYKVIIFILRRMKVVPSMMIFIRESAN